MEIKLRLAECKTSTPPTILSFHLNIYLYGMKNNSPGVLIKKCMTEVAMDIRYYKEYLVSQGDLSFYGVSQAMLTNQMSEYAKMLICVGFRGP